MACVQAPPCGRSPRAGRRSEAPPEARLRFSNCPLLGIPLLGLIVVAKRWREKETILREIGSIPPAPCSPGEARALQRVALLQARIERIIPALLEALEAPLGDDAGQQCRDRGLRRALGL